MVRLPEMVSLLSAFSVLVATSERGNGGTSDRWESTLLFNVARRQELKWRSALTSRGGRN
jgi:hypothetical protein